MKKLYLFLFINLFAGSFFSQTISAERSQLIAQEAANYAKMVNYNVNPNTLNYDLKYQRLDLNLDPAVYFISGTVTSHFIPNQNISSIYFDLSNVLMVSEVNYHGTNLNFQQLSTQEIKIDFPAAIPSNVMDSLSIKYSGAPTTANQSFSTSTQNGVPVLYTLSEPYGAQDWFPTKQSMNDKIDEMDVKITSPAAYSVASNGKFMSETILPSGKKLTFWQTKYPLAAYLVAVGVTNYSKFFDTMGSSSPFPFVNYVYPTTAANSAVMSNIQWTKLAMDNFENYFGPYPFRNEKYGHMEFSYPGTCMEHQTMSSMSSWGKSTIAHEMAHQWFGDKITCGAWNDIWLNEGFATFAEHLTNEKLLMTQPQFLSYLQSEKDYVTSSSNGSLYVADSNLSNINAVFSGRLTYSKGGYLLRMLKWILGDNVFYQALKDYNSRPNLAYNYAKSTDFATSLQTSTGKDFTEFFNDWLYGQGYPTYTIKWKQIGSNIRFFVSQTQSNSAVSFFEMPLPIKVTGTGGQTAFLVLNNTVNNQYFDLPVSFPVSTVTFNYEYQILERNSTVTQDANLATTEVSNELKIFPNPVKSELKISGLKQKESFEIFSANGNLVKKGNLDAVSGLNVSSLSPGMYVLKLGGKNLKFIKE